MSRLSGHSAAQAPPLPRSGSITLPAPGPGPSAAAAPGPSDAAPARPSSPPRTTPPPSAGAAAGPSAARPPGVQASASLRRSGSVAGRLASVGSGRLGGGAVSASSTGGVAGASEEDELSTGDARQSEANTTQVAAGRVPA
jgi:hypothetical protein